MGIFLGFAIAMGILGVTKQMTHTSLPVLLGMDALPLNTS